MDWKPSKSGLSQTSYGRPRALRLIVIQLLHCAAAGESGVPSAPTAWNSRYAVSRSCWCAGSAALNVRYRYRPTRNRWLLHVLRLAGVSRAATAAQNAGSSPWVRLTAALAPAAPGAPGPPAGPGEGAPP